MSRQSILLAALAGILVIALWWMFLYSPGQEELARIEDEVAAAETEQVSLQQRVAQLEAVRSRAPETEAAIARVQSVLPDDPALPSALRQVAAAADDAGIELDAVATSRPSVLDEAVGLHSASISLSATGSYFQVVDFLRRLEDPQITARGITFNNLSVSPVEHPALTVSLSGEMFAVLEPPPTPEDAAAPEGADETTDETTDDAAGVTEGEES